MNEREQREAKIVVEELKKVLNEMLRPLNKKITMVDEYDPVLLERWK